MAKQRRDAEDAEQIPRDQRDLEVHAVRSLTHGVRFRAVVVDSGDGGKRPRRAVHESLERRVRDWHLRRAGRVIDAPEHRQLSLLVHGQGPYEHGIGDAEDRRLLTEVLCWFWENLVTPDRSNRSKSKAFYRRTSRGIVWFRDTATDCLSRMHQIKTTVEKYGHPVTMLTERRIGYVVYEDELQAVAEPFSDTQTG